LWEGSRRTTANDQKSDDIFSTHERRSQPRLETGTQSDLVDLIGSLIPQAGNLDRLGLRESLNHVRIIKANAS
jgi:hypothetical protein